MLDAIVLLCFGAIFFILPVFVTLAVMLRHKPEPRGFEVLPPK